MSKYRKKPVVIEAFRLGEDDMPDWFMDMVSYNAIILHLESRNLSSSKSVEGFCLIKTLEGEMRGECGDYIIQGIKREIYPCKPDIFEATYEAVNE